MTGRVLEARSLTVEFTARSGAVARAVDGVDLRLGAGEIVALVGESGSGKTTLARTLMGLERPVSGGVLLDGAPVGYDRAALNDLRRRAGLVFQDPDSQLFAASVRQDISFGPINPGLSEDEVRRRV